MTVSTSWLLFLFSLPARQASARVEVWRKLQRYGAVALRGSGYLLPAGEPHRERLEWLAALVRKNRGEASVLEVTAVDDLPQPELARMFREARARDYQALEKEARRGLANRPSAATLGRLRRKLQEIAAIDFFEAPERGAVEELLRRAEGGGAELSTKGAQMRKQFRKRVWLTRPRPKIDRSASAWLIRRFIDPAARFTFAASDARHPEAVPFDMFGGRGFGHRGDDCTFETLRKEFGIDDRRVKVLAEIVHDADLRDEKFGRSEALGVDRVLDGWARTKLSDAELLRRGMELIEGLYESLA
jgi:hypothetical protein